MVWTRASVVRLAAGRRAVARAAVVASVAVVVAVAAVGCSDDEPEPAPGPGPVETSSVDGPSPGPTPGPDDGPDDEAPVAPPEMDRADEAGAEAFAKHYFALVNHAQATGQLEALEAAALPGCEACTGGRDWIARTHRNGGSIEGGDFLPRRIQVTRVDAGDGDRFGVEIDLSTTEQRVLGSGGKELSTAKAGNFSIHMSLVHVPGRGWRVAFWEET